MSKVRVESFTISLHGWAVLTRTFQKNLFGNDGGVYTIS